MLKCGPLSIGDSLYIFKKLEDSSHLGTKTESYLVEKPAIYVQEDISGEIRIKTEQSDRQLSLKFY